MISYYESPSLFAVVGKNGNVNFTDISHFRW